MKVSCNPLIAEQIILESKVTRLECFSIIDIKFRGKESNKNVKAAELSHSLINEALEVEFNTELMNFDSSYA